MVKSVCKKYAKYRGDDSRGYDRGTIPDQGLLFLFFIKIYYNTDGRDKKC